MIIKDSQAMLDVWKEEIYQEVKNLPVDQMLARISSNAKETAAKIEKELKLTGNG